MMDPLSLQETLRSRMFVMKILWTAMVVTVLLFVGLAYFINAQQQPDVAQPQLQMVLYGVAGVLAVMSFFLRRRFLSSHRNLSISTLEKAMRGLVGDGQAEDAEVPAQVRRMQAIDAKVGALSGRYFTAMILSLAMHESIALCGMILAMIERRFEAMIPFAIAAIVLDLLIYPRLDKYVEASMVSAPPF
jgi:F0F1-type ATP synthase membrane subunit c/vacuolar-type H+-ATPase subunit K